MSSTSDSDSDYQSDSRKNQGANQYQRPIMQNQKPVQQQQYYQQYPSAQQVSIYELMKDISELKAKQKEMKKQIKELQKENQELRQLIDDQGIQTKNPNYMKNNDNSIGKVEYLQFKNWVKQSIENLQKQLQFNKASNFNSKPQGEAMTINIGAEKVQQPQKPAHQPVQQQPPPKFEIQAQKTKPIPPPQQNSKQYVVPENKPPQQPPYQKQQQNKKEVKPSKTAQQPPPTKKQQQQIVSIKHSFLNGLEERGKTCLEPVKVMYNKLKEKFSILPDTKFTNQFYLKSKEDVDEFIKTIYLSWFDTTALTTELQLKNTVIMAQNLEKWGIKINMNAHYFQTVKDNTWCQLFDAMGDKQLFRCVINSPQNMIVVRRRSDGAIFKSADLTEEWFYEYEDELLNAECDVLMNDYDCNLGPYYLSAIHLSYYHYKTLIEFNLTDPQLLKSCYLENALIANIEDCAELTSMCCYNNSHTYDDVQNLPLFENYYRHDGQQ